MPTRWLKLTVAYDGTAYAGWQVQPDQPTVQGVLERAWREITQEAVRLTAAGRTDAMVALRPPSIAAVPLARVVGRVRRVPRGHDAILAARALGIYFGDEAVGPAVNGRRRSRR